MSIELSILAPHVPSICHEDQVPDFQQPIVDAHERRCEGNRSN